LKIGLNMPVPIPDLRLDDESMSCTLSFNRAKFFCVVPWMSVFAMVGDDGRGMVWPDDVPQELAVRVEDRRPQGIKGAEGKAGEAREEMPASTRSPGRGKSRASADAPRESERGNGSTRSRAEEPASTRGDEAPSSLAERGQRRSRKKKKEEARPVLVAVPSPEKSSPRVEKLDERRENAERATPSTPKIDRPAPSRPKRELPPYLRVVK
jgi:hypothetical protein